MDPRLACAALAAAIAWTGAPAVLAQSPAAPRFAPPNLSANGVRALAANCTQCHGTEGRGVADSGVAPLAGRDAAELRALLASFKAGRARATVMDQIARGYSDEEIAALADYFARRGG